MTIIKIDNQIRINANELLHDVIQKLEERLTFANPRYEQNEKYSRWNRDTPEFLSFLEKDGDFLILPRGFILQLLKILKVNNISYRINDQTRKLDDVDFTFNGNLYDYQKQACRKVSTKRFAVLQSPTGSGKTTMALAITAKRKQPTLIIVHTKELLFQWQEKIEQFLGISKGEIGLIGDGRNTIGDKITVGIANSLKKCASEVKNRIGFLISGRMP